MESQDEVCHSRTWSPGTRCVTAGPGVPGRGVSQQDLESQDEVCHSRAWSPGTRCVRGVSQQGLESQDQVSGSKGVGACSGNFYIGRKITALAFGW